MVERLKFEQLIVCNATDIKNALSIMNKLIPAELEKGKVILKPKKIDLRSLIQEVSQIYQKKIAEKNDKILS
jgi:thymidylate synthase